MDINEIFAAQKNATVGDLRSRGIALSMADVSSIMLNDLRIAERYEDRKKTGEPDLDEFGNPKVSLNLHFVLKSGEEIDVSTASEYMKVNLVQQLVANKDKAVEIEDLYILPYKAKGGTRKDGSEYGQQLFELRFKDIKVKSFEPTTK